VIEPITALPQAVRARAIEIGLVSVPREVAQEVVNRLVQAGVRGILNFAPAVVETPPGVWVENVDFLAGLARLTYFVTQEVEGKWI
jgi:redox-sensing transcriptional repressor